MVYFSELIGKEIYDVNRVKIGIVKDFCFRDAVRYAKITGIIINDKKDLKIGWNHVAGLGNNENDDLPFVIYLNIKESKLTLTKVNGQKVSDILDKQIIDVNGARVVRVNDVLLGKVGKALAIIGVSVGTQGIFRRLGINWLANKSKEHIIIWKDVAPLAPDIQNLQVKQKSERINEMHPSEIADLIRDLSLEEKLFIFNNLSNEKAAKTLIKAQPEVRSGVFKTLSIKRLSTMLEIMPTHEAAAILNLMPLIHNEKVLKQMKPGIADKIRKLLKYADRTGGSLMSTRYTALSEEFTVGDVVDLIKKVKPQSRHILYFYVTDDQGVLKGVVSMKYLIMSEKDVAIKDIMKRDVITVSPHTDIDDIFNIMTRYDLNVVPVVDKEKKLLGVIRVHDLFEKIIPNRIKTGRIVKAKRLSSQKSGKLDSNKAIQFP